MPMNDKTAYLPVEDCKHRHLYRIDARNLPIGVWNEKTRGFTGIRLKFGALFLDVEYHWDMPQFATAKPLELLEALPEGILTQAHENPDLFAWLKEAETRWCPETKGRLEPTGDWRSRGGHK